MKLNGVLWLIIFMCTDAIKSLISFDDMLNAGKQITWVKWDIAIFSLILAGATGLRLFLDQSYARWRESRNAEEKKTETEFYRQQAT